MSIKIVCSWRTLFQKAHAMGQARLRYIKDPSTENEQELSDLSEDHKSYEELCLKADEMVDTPCLSLPPA